VRKLLPVYFLFLSFLLAAEISSAAFVVPPLTGPVVDQGNLISESDKRMLTALIRDFHQREQGQIQILTVESLEDTPIEQASIQVTDAWKIGDARRDDGVLLMVSAKERKIRIEVGQGLEGVIPDVFAKRIIDDLMKPIMRERSPSQGIVAGAVQIMKMIVPDLQAQVADVRPRKQNPFKKYEGLIFILFLIFMGIGRVFGGGGRGRGFMGGGGWGGGGGFGGFGGGSGGGWSGGGGGFSGGGSSGSW
jgi:uncharacterized protein